MFLRILSSDLDSDLFRSPKRVGDVLHGRVSARPVNAALFPCFFASHSTESARGSSLKTVDFVGHAHGCGPSIMAPETRTTRFSGISCFQLRATASSLVGIQNETSGTAFAIVRKW